MARIISLVNQKGGTAKTTSAVNLGAYLAAMGKYVLLVDLDPQANAVSGLGINKDNVTKDLYHILADKISAADAVTKTSLFGFDAIPSSPDLAGAAIELINHPRREFKLFDSLQNVRTNYDYILIDCPPSLGLLTINGLTVADDVIIPVQCEYYALEGLSQLLKTIQLVKENLGSETNILGALLTMYDKRNRLSREVMKEVKLNFPGNVFESIIPRCVKLAEAPSFGQTILQFDPNGKGAKAYRQLAEEVISLEI